MKRCPGCEGTRHCKLGDGRLKCLIVYLMPMLWGLDLTQVPEEVLRFMTK